MLAQNHFVADLAYKWKKKIKSPTTKEFIVTAWKVTLHSIHKRKEGFAIKTQYHVALQLKQKPSGLFVNATFLLQTAEKLPLPLSTFVAICSLQKQSHSKAEHLTVKCEICSWNLKVKSEMRSATFLPTLFANASLNFWTLWYWWAFIWNNCSLNYIQWLKISNQKCDILLLHSGDGELRGWLCMQFMRMTKEDEVGVSKKWQQNRHGFR